MKFALILKLKFILPKTKFNLKIERRTPIQIGFLVIKFAYVYGEMGHVELYVVQKIFIFKKC